MKLYKQKFITTKCFIKLPINLPLTKYRFSTIKDKLIDKENNFCTNDNVNVNNTLNAHVVTNQGNSISVMKSTTLKKELSELTKFKLCILNMSVSISTFAYYTSAFTFLNFSLFSIGTLTAAMTTQVLNQIIEKSYDKNMTRTHLRPLPTERLNTNQAYITAAVLYSTSIAAFLLSTPHAIYMTSTILSLYIFAYTPLKRINNSSMHIGALVGALPSLLGSFAATGKIIISMNDPAFLLGAYIFCWQYPHFYGILFQNKEDYKKAGFEFISNHQNKTYVSYIQMLLASGMILYIAYKLRTVNIFNKYTFPIFVSFYIYNLIPILKFIQNPSKYAKIIRVRSYSPFLLILGSFIYASIVAPKKEILHNI